MARRRRRRSLSGLSDTALSGIFALAAVGLLIVVYRKNVPMLAGLGECGCGR